MGADKTYTTYLVYRYVEDCFTELAALLSPDLNELTNLPNHGLKEAELVTLLYELFQNHSLAAVRTDRGFFTPTREEIEAAVLEDRVLLPKRIDNTFYSLTSAAYDTFNELKAKYEHST